MKSRLALLLLCLPVLSGCTATARLYPVQGPLAAQTPSPVYVAKMTDGLHAGNFSAVLSDGEVCKGRWEIVARPKTSGAPVSANDTAKPNLASEWDIVYGPGYYVAHVLGSRLYGRAVVSGDRGTVLNVEIYKPDTSKDATVSSIKGVAKDNNSNIYKVTF
jgi:hypothetical protein